MYDWRDGRKLWNQYFNKHRTTPEDQLAQLGRSSRKLVKGVALFIAWLFVMVLFGYNDFTSGIAVVLVFVVAYLAGEVWEDSKYSHLAPEPSTDSAHTARWWYLALIAGIALVIGFLAREFPLVRAFLVISGVVALWLIVPVALIISIVPHERFPAGTKWIAEWFKNPPRPPTAPEPPEDYPPNDA